MENYEKIRQLVSKPANKLTAKDREFIVRLAAEYDVKINTLCKNCYIDAAVEIYTKIHPQEKQPSASAGGYVLRAGVDIILNGKYRVNAATLTEANARLWLQKGLPVSYFETIPDNDSNGEN